MTIVEKQSSVCLLALLTHFSSWLQLEQIELQAIESFPSQLYQLTLFINLFTWLSERAIGLPFEMLVH